MTPLHDADNARVGPYTIHGILGTGGMGQVFLGTGPDGRTVAVKVIHESLAGDEQFRRRFAREVSAARRITSPRVAQVIAADPDAPRPWMATTYVAGKNLQQAMETTTDEELVFTPLSLPAVMALAVGVGEALVEIHAAGVTHRDLKPTNILLSDDGPKVIDFGIARAIEMSTVTVLGEITGSAGFMSPEQMQGLEIGPPSDMFSLGSVLFFAATGTYAFGAGPLPAALYRIVHEEPDLSTIADVRLRRIIEGCLQKDAAKRLTAQDVLALAQGADVEDRGPAEAPFAVAPGVGPSGWPSVTSGPSSEVGTSPEGGLSPKAGPSPEGGAAKAPSRSTTARRASAMIAAAVVLVLVSGTLLVFRHLSDAAASSPTSTATTAGEDGSGATAPVASDSAVPSTPTAPSSSSRSASPGATSSTSVLPTGVPTGSTIPTTRAPTNAAPRTTAPKSTAPKAANAKRYSSTELSVPGDATARVYFGRLGDVTSAASGVTFANSGDYRRANSDLCALTVVVRDVDGSEATVYANGLGTGWRGAETVPSSDSSVDDGAVHQQLIVPPTGTRAGKVWTGSGLLRVDGTDSYSGRYTLTHRSGGDDDGLWLLDGTPVSCSVY